MNREVFNWLESQAKKLEGVQSDFNNETIVKEVKYSEMEALDIGTSALLDHGVRFVLENKDELHLELSCEMNPKETQNLVSFLAKHFHDYDEEFIVLEGYVKCKKDDRIFIEKGKSYTFPRNTVHTPYTGVYTRIKIICHNPKYKIKK